MGVHKRITTMFLPRLGLCVLCCAIYIQDCSGVYSPEMETQIRSETLYGAGYDFISRPEGQTHIAIGINVLAIDELNLKGQKLTVAGWLTLEWDDYRLKWDKAARDNMTYIFSRPQEIWKPELIIDNSLSNLGVLVDRELYLRIKYTGLVEWEPSRLFTTHCEVDITYYPYDRQRCGIQVVSWGYTVDEVTLDHLYETINLEDFVPHGEWVIEETEIEDMNLTEHHPDGTVLVYPQLNFWIHLKRRTEFYNMNVMLPIVVTSLMVGIVFLVPIHSGEKISFGMTVFLSMAVLLTIVSDALPPTSISTSILGLYLAIVLVTTGFGILLTVMILIIFHHSGTPHEDSFIISVTKCAARCICWHYPNKPVPKAPKENEEKEKPPVKETKQTTPGRGNVKTSVIKTTMVKGNIVKVLPLEVKDVDDEFDDIKEEYDVEPITWQRVAQILDRFLFYIFFSANVFMNVSFVIVLSIGSDTVKTNGHGASSDAAH